MIGIKDLVKHILNKRYEKINSRKYEPTINKYLGKKGLYALTTYNSTELSNIIKQYHNGDKDDALTFGKFFYPIATPLNLTMHDKVNIILGRLGYILPKNKETNVLLQPVDKTITKYVPKIIKGGDFENYPNKLINTEDIKRVKLKYIMNDHFNNDTHPDDAYIMNLDHDGGGGTHWVCVFIDARDGVLCYIDPFGSELLNGTPTKSVEQYALDNNLHIITNRYTIQHVNSNMCGYYAIYFAYMMKKLYAKEKITSQSMHKELKKHFTTSPSKNNIEMAMNFYKNIIN